MCERDKTKTDDDDVNIHEHEDQDDDDVERDVDVERGWVLVLTMLIIFHPPRNSQKRKRRLLDKAKDKDARRSGSGRRG